MAGLFRLWSKQSERAFQRDLKERHVKLYRLAYAWCHQADLAEDLVQETFVKAMEKRDEINEIDYLDAWLCRVMRNKFLDNLRYYNRWEMVEDALIDEYLSQDCIETEVLQKERHALLHDAMVRLHFMHREVITLCDLEGFSYLEIAEITSVPVGTVMSRLARGREQLRKILQASALQEED